MAWPPAAGSTTFQVHGTLPATIAWGTDGMYSGIIVKSVRVRQMIEEIKIENGSGLTSNQVLLNDGDEVEITCVDDRALTFPASNATITLLSPLPTGAAGTSELFQVIDNSYNAARKQEGERVIMAKKYTLITAS